VADKKNKAAPADSVNALAAPGALESGEKVKNYADDETSDVYKEAQKLYRPVQAAYNGKQEQIDRIEEYRNIYACKLDANQSYTGNSQCYVPAVRDCINARSKRALKQLFPTRYRHVEAVGSDPEIPYAQLALLEHDIRSTNLKEIVRSDLVAGDVTGQWGLYIDWTRSYRRITTLIKRNPELESVEGEEVGVVDPSEEEEETEESDLLEEGPEVVDFATEDLAVVPPTCNDIEKAEAVSLKLRLSKEKVMMLVEEGVFVTPKGQSSEQMWDELEKSPKGDAVMDRRIPPKIAAQNAGIKTEGSYKYLLAYEVTARLSFDDEENPGKKIKRLAYIYYASAERILGIVCAPQWGGKRPVISAPCERVSGSFFGQSKIEPVKFMQWNLTDYWNMGQDSAMYSLLPVWAADPLKNPNWAGMVMGLAAVWPIAPGDVKAITAPQLYKEALTICDQIKKQIWESMDVNEMMMGKMPSGRKNNAMMNSFQQDQMTNIMDHAERYEECMLTPLVERLFEYERQFRTKSLLVETRGEIGVKAKMTDVDPKQFDERYRFQWAGTTIVSGQQLQQMRIAGMNVLRGIPPQQLNGRRLDVTPILESFVEGLYGPEMGPKILIDERNMFTVPAEVENEMMHNNLPVQIHEADNDQEHLISHMSAARLTGDQAGRFRAHIAGHTMAMQAKLQKQAGAMPGAPGVPGPQGTAPGVPGSPRPGAQPAGNRGMAQNPPGIPGADQMGPGRG
jgi:hypothetical protein